MNKLKKLYGGLRRENYILFFGCMVTKFGAMVHAVLTLILSQKMGFSAAKVSYFMVLFGLVNMLFSVLGGKLSDRFNKKYCIIFCDSLSIMFYILCTFMDLSIPFLIILFVAAGLQSMETPIYDALIADITTKENRQKAYALQYLGVNLGILFAPTLAGLLFKNHLKLLFVISAIAIGISTILIALLVKNIKPVRVESITEKRRDGVSIFKVLMDNKVLFIYAILMAIYSVCYSQCGYLLPLDLGRMYGENGALIYGTINSTNCLIVVVFSTVVLYAFGNIKPHWKMSIAQSLIAIGYIVYLIFMTKIPAYYISITLFTFGEIFATLGSQPFFTSRTPASHRGRINGFREGLRQGLNSIMLIVSGNLYDTKGYMVAWTVVLVTISLSTLITVLINIKIDKEK